jgi:hypothetical protein
VSEINIFENDIKAFNALFEDYYNKDELNEVYRFQMKVNF